MMGCNLPFPRSVLAICDLDRIIFSIKNTALYHPKSSVRKYIKYILILRNWLSDSIPVKNSLTRA